MKKSVLLLAAALTVYMGIASPAKASGGSGGGGGSTSAVCTFINDYKVTSGYTPSSSSSMGAVWVQWKLNPCTSPSGQGFAIEIKLTDVNAGALLYTIPAYSAQQLIDFDNLKTGTAYHVDFRITDRGTGAVLESRSTDISTPSHNRTGL